MSLNTELATQIGINLVKEHGGRIPENHSLKEEVEKTLGEKCWEILIAEFNTSQALLSGEKK